jgi:hypothetical protein
LWICMSFKKLNLVGGGPRATPSQQNGSYRPGKPLMPSSA